MQAGQPAIDFSRAAPSLYARPHVPDADHLEIPDCVSPAAAAYLASRMELFDFVIWVGTVADQSDEARRIAAEALAEFEPDPAKRAELEKTAKADDAKKEQERFFLLLRETVFTRSVDSFLSYLADLLATVFKTRPEALRSSETVEVAYVLAHDSIDAFIETLAEDRVEALSQAGFAKLRDHFVKQLKFDPFADVEPDEVARAITYRNVYVHNRGIVNRTFLKRVSDPDRFTLGEYLALRPEEIMTPHLDRAVVSIDARAATKWGVERPLTKDDVRELARRTQAAKERSATEESASDPGE